MPRDHWHNLSEALLQHLNEELEASKQEIESANAELAELNQRILHRNRELVERGEFISALLSAIPVPTLALDERKRVIEANRAFYDTFHVVPEATLGRPIERVGDAGDLFLPLKRPLRDLFAGSGASDSAPPAEANLNLGAEGVRTFEIQARWMPGMPSHAATLVCCIEDVTARKLEAARLRNQVEQLGAVTSGLAAFDRNLRITFANPPFLAIVGSGAGCLGAAADSLLPEEMVRALQQPRPASGEVLLRTAQGAKQVRWEASPAPRLGWVLELRDVSDLKRMMAGLLESETLASNGRLAAALAHEINNPLGSVNNALYLLGQNPELPPRARDLIRTASDELGRVIRIVRSTLGLYARGEEAVVAPAEGAISSALELLAPQIAEKRLRVHRRERAAAAVSLPPGELRQIVANLLGNAIEAAPEGGQIVIAMFGHRLLIADNGPGITPEMRERLFQPFASSKRGRGTGLGLWVVAEITRRNGVRIQVKSRNTAPSGTCFALRFPAQP